MRVNKMATLLLIVLCLCFCQSKGSECKYNITIEIKSSPPCELSDFSVCGNSIDTDKIMIQRSINQHTVTFNYDDLNNHCLKCPTNHSLSTTVPDNAYTTSPSSVAVSAYTTSPASVAVSAYTTSPASVPVPVLNNSTGRMLCVSPVALGSVIGVIVLLLAVVTIGWIWTCCVMKKRRKLTINSEKNR